MKRLLRDVEQLIRVLHGIANGITVQDTDGKLVFVNRAAARMMNCASPEEAIEKGPEEILKGFEFFNEQGQRVKIKNLPGRLALTGVEEPEMMVSYRSEQNPELQWTIIKAMPIFDKTGQVILAVNVLQDITQLKIAEQKLKDANERITALLEEVLVKQIESGPSRPVSRRTTP